MGKLTVKLTDKLTAQQNIFVSEYVISRNGKLSAIKAGYSPKTAEVQASRLLSVAKIKDAVDTLLKQREARTLITADSILKGIHEIALNAERDADKLKAYELLGKNQKLFTDKMELSGDKDRPVEINVNIIDDE